MHFTRIPMHASGILIFLSEGDGHHVSDDHVVVGVRMGDEVVVGSL